MRPRAVIIAVAILVLCIGLMTFAVWHHISPWVLFRGTRSVGGN